MLRGGVPVPSFVRRGVIAGFVCTALAMGVFGGQARAATPEQLSSAAFDHVLVRENGSIVAAGHADGHPFVARFGQDGRADTSFADGGVIEFPALEGAAIVDLLSSPDGGAVLVTAGSLVKITAAGRPDPAFGDAGLVSSVARDLLDGRPITAAGIQADGKILVANATYDEGIDVARFTTTGSPDMGFAGDGTFELMPPHPGGLVSAADIEIDPQGRIVVAGEIDYAGGAMRLESDGALDTDFGSNAPGFTGEYVPSANVGIFRGVADVVLGVDGEVRVYGARTVNTYVGQNIGYFFDEDGAPAGRPREYEAQGSMVFAETPDGGLASTMGGFRGEGAGFNVLRSPLANGEPGGFEPRAFSLSPGDAVTTAIAYSPTDDTLVAVGRTRGFSCAGKCDDRNFAVLVKIDAKTGTPVTGFGTQGSALIPAVQCGFGEAHLTGRPDRSWKRCRVTPPELKARIAFQHGKSRRPALKGSVELRGAQARPELMERALTITLPRKVKPRRGAARKFKIEVEGIDRSEWVASLGGRVIEVRITPGVKKYDSFYGPPAPVNSRVVVGFKFKRGAIRALKPKHRRAQLDVKLDATYTPTGQPYGIGGPAIDWYAPNRSITFAKTRPAQPKGKS